MVVLKIEFGFTVVVSLTYAISVIIHKFVGVQSLELKKVLEGAVLFMDSVFRLISTYSQSLKLWFHTKQVYYHGYE